MKSFLKNKIASIYVFCVLITTIFFGVKNVSAQSRSTTNTTQIDFSDANPLTGISSIWELVAAILDFIVKVGAAVVVFFLIYAGFLFVSAGGSDDKITKAKKYFFGVIIGALLILGAQVLSSVICNTANQIGAQVGNCSFF